MSLNQRRGYSTGLCVCPQLYYYIRHCTKFLYQYLRQNDRNVLFGIRLLRGIWRTCERDLAELCLRFGDKLIQQRRHRVIPLELINSNRDGIRKASEAFLISKGKTLEPYGMNRRDET